MNSEKCQLENFLLYWYLDALLLKHYFLLKHPIFGTHPAL